MNDMNDVAIFIDKMKTVFSLIPDEEIDLYNEMYNGPAEAFIAWINKKYTEYKDKFDKYKKFFV